MPTIISDDYRLQNRNMHKAKSTYGAGGHLYATYVGKLMRKFNTKDVLDYGCGKGTLRKRLGDFVKEFDPAILGKDIPPVPADIVVCTDVMEHIEPEYLENVLEHLRYLTKKTLYLTIACRPAKKSLPDGRNAHLIVQSREWWEDKLRSKFTISDSGELPKEGFWCICAPLEEFKEF